MTVSVKKKIWHFTCLKCLACCSHPFLHFHGSQLSQRRLVIICQMLKSPHVVSVEIYLPKATRPDPSPPPPTSFCLYPSTKLVPVKKDVPVIFLYSLLLFLILFSLSAIHKATLNMLKLGKMYPFSTLHPHSILILSLYPYPFHRYTSLTLLITFLPRFLALSLLLSLPSTPLLQSPVISSLSSPDSVASIHPPLHLYCIYRT